MVIIDVHADTVNMIVFVFSDGGFVKTDILNVALFTYGL